MVKTTIELMEEALDNLKRAEVKVIDLLEHGKGAASAEMDLGYAWDDVRGLMRKVEELAARRQALKNARKSDIKS